MIMTSVRIDVFVAAQAGSSQKPCRLYPLGTGNFKLASMSIGYVDVDMDMFE